MSFLVFGGLVAADTLTVAASGTFGGNVTADTIAAPSESWTLSFDISSNPAAANVSALAFDAPFSNFTYTLNGSPIAVTPGEIQFEMTANLGLFTVYFGPESGFTNGLPIPIFSFEGDQAFSGTTAAPVILPGIYPATDTLYTDASNYDDEGALDTVTISAGTVASAPEPATGWLSAGAAAVLTLLACRGGKAIQGKGSA